MFIVTGRTGPLKGGLALRAPTPKLGGVHVGRSSTVGGSPAGNHGEGEVRMKGQTVFLAAVHAVFLASVVEAQEPPLVVPGSGLVDASVVEPGLDTLQLLVVQPDGTERPISRLTRSVRPTVVDGTTAWIIVQRYESDRGVNVDSSLVRRSDLAPLRYAASVSGEIQRFEFQGARVTGTVQPPDSAVRAVSHELRGPFFNAVVDSEVILSLPLAAGFEARIASYNPPWPPPPGPTVVRVTGTEWVATAGGNVEAWMVAYDGGGAPTRLWISKDEPRILATRSELRGGTVFWKLPAADLPAWRARWGG